MFQPAHTHASPLTSEQLAMLRLIRGKGIGPATFYKLMDHYGTAVKAVDAAETGQVKASVAPINVVQEEQSALQKMGAGMVFYTDDHYPAALKMLPDAPPVLTYLGDVSLLQRKQIALVGSRNASAHGCRFTQKLAADLSAQGWCVTSGLARGIDTAAHKGGLSGEGKTIAVLGGGLDHIYPPENAPLYKEIAQNGVIIAETPIGTPPTAQSFPKRNRIVAGLSAGVVVVEAAAKSGSLITARTALDQGREVLAVPGHPSDPRSHGANHLIRQGATLITSAADIIEAVQNFKFEAPVIHTPKFFTREELDDMRPEEEPTLALELPAASNVDVTAESLEAKIMQALSATPTAIDDVVQAVGAPTAAVTATLSEMEMDGIITRGTGGFVALKS